MQSAFSSTKLRQHAVQGRRSDRVQTQALFGKKKQAESTKPKPKKGQSVLEALDFSKVRSKEDANLLYEARFGKRGADGKMSKEQAQALRRKVGGTAKDYWKDWVETKGDYTDKGYVSRQNATVPGLPFLIGVVVAMLGAVVYVVAQTS